MCCQCKNRVKTFYWYFRPIAILCKLFGVLPLQNLHYADGSKIYFRYVSIAHFYSTAMFIAVLFLFGYYSQFKFEDPQKGAMIAWKIGVALMMIVRSALCFMFCVHHSRRLPKLIKLLVLFDKKKCCLINVKEKRVKKFFIRAVFPLLHGIFYMLISFTELRFFIAQILREDIRDTENGEMAAIIFGILGDWQILPMLLYTYFAYVIKSNFNDINDAMASYVSIENIGSDTAQYDPNLAKVIENIRCLHTITSMAVNQLSDSYGSFMAVDQFCINIMFVVNFYVYFYSGGQDFHLLLCTVISAVLVVAVIMISHKVKEYAIRVLDSLQCIRLCSVDDAAKMEIQLFTTQLASRPIEISAAGYFVMDRNQIPSILSSVATYLIVLIQFTSNMYTQEHCVYNVSEDITINNK